MNKKVKNPIKKNEIQLFNVYKALMFRQRCRCERNY